MPQSSVNDTTQPVVIEDQDLTQPGKPPPTTPRKDSPNHAHEDLPQPRPGRTPPTIPRQWLKRETMTANPINISTNSVYTYYDLPQFIFTTTYHGFLIGVSR